MTQVKANGQSGDGGKVRDKVLAETGGLQEPLLDGSLGAEPLYFARQ